jgi:cyclophilin family peptidyl-prolyl cis-trans isomerase
MRRFVRCVALAAVFVAGPNSSPGQAPAPAAPNFGQLASDEELVAVIQVTAATDTLGSICVRLYDKSAPAHALNFAKLAASGFFDGTSFHRIGPESFVQGGDPLSRDADPANDGTGGPGYDLTPELGDTPFLRGTVGAASMGKRDNGSQFFICLKDHPEWDGKYTPIGVVISGIEVADKVAAAKHKGDRPLQPLQMTVRVEKRTRKVKLY